MPRASELGAKEHDVIQRAKGTHPYLVIQNREVLGVLKRGEGRRFDDFCPLTELEWDDWQLLSPQQLGEPVRYEEITLEEVKPWDLLSFEDIDGNRFEATARCNGHFTWRGKEGGMHWSVRSPIDRVRIRRIFRVHNMPKLPAPQEKGLEERIRNQLESLVNDAIACGSKCNAEIVLAAKEIVAMKAL